eukprot:7522480-Lingulodinium_polyedra.AAC.1
MASTPVVGSRGADPGAGGYAAAVPRRGASPGAALGTPADREGLAETAGRTAPQAGFLGAEAGAAAPPRGPPGADPLFAAEVGRLGLEPSQLASLLA